MSKWFDKKWLDTLPKSVVIQSRGAGEKRSKAIAEARANGYIVVERDGQLMACGENGGYVIE